MQLGYLLAYGT